MLPLGSTGDSHQSSPRMPVPVGSSQPNEGRHQIDSACIGHSLCYRFGLGGSLDQLKPVPDPLNGRASDKNSAFQCVDRQAFSVTSQCRQKFIFRKNMFFPQVQKQETPGPISVLEGSRLVATLAEKSGLLVACDACYGNSRP